VHYLYGVVCVVLAFELNKTKALVLVAYFISRNMHVDDRTALGHELPEDTLVDFLIEVARVDSGLLVALVEGGDGGHTLIMVINIMYPKFWH